MRDLNGHVATPSLPYIERYYLHGIEVMAPRDFPDDGPLVGLSFLGFDVSASKLSKIIEDEVNGIIVVWDKGRHMHNG